MTILLTDGRQERLDSLNRAFEKAFSHTASRETLVDLLECMGEELACDRISIFELNLDKTCDNTYEWCRPGKTHVKELLQNLPLSTFDDWMDQIRDQEFLCVRDMETIRTQEPDVYRLFHSQEVHAAIVSRLAFHGRNIGFFILENPGEEILTDVSTVMPGMRYILSSLVYSDHLLRRLEQIGYTDHLTGAGNRVGLQGKLSHLSAEQSLGIVYCEVLGWENDDGQPSQLREEQALIRTGEILQGLYDEDCTFRIAPGEFVTLVTGLDTPSFEMMAESLRRLFIEHGLLVAVGLLYQEHAGTDHDALIRQAHMHAHSEIRELTKDHMARMRKASGDIWLEGDAANVSLYRTDEFFRYASEYFGEWYEETLMTIVIDINYFKLYNDIFGRKAGNLLLEQIASQVLEVSRAKGGVAGYLGGDNFCLILPCHAEHESELLPLIHEVYETFECPEGFSLAMGVYLSKDRQETLVAMYDHALTALQDIKGSYVDHYRFYDVDHYKRDRESKILMLDARRGLAGGEFMFYLQPQVNEKTGKIVGAEALSRWNNRGQMVSPAQFIPALEKSGYIYSMDCFIWEEVCKWLRSLIDRGIRPVPISINVSRVDFYFEDIAQHFIDLLARYNLPPYLLGIEITESAFTDNMDTIVDAVQRLHKAGFRVLMDDFGSGSSSLSMLHTVNLDVLKTDVRFMSDEEADSRAYSIVGSVVSMAHMIGMIVVTEGVETEEQRNNLVAMGGNFAQGFYFYRPMPVPDFEALLQDPEKIADTFEHGMHVGENHLKFRELVGNGMLSETLLDNIIGAAAVYKLQDGNFQLTQMNEQYKQLAGLEDVEGYSKLHENFLKNNHDRLFELIHEADARPFEGAVSAVTTTKGPMDIRLFLLYTSEEHKLYFLTFE